MKDCAYVSRMEAEFETEARCLVTGEPMHPAIEVPRDWRRMDDPRRWSIWWADAARFGQIHPRPDPEQIAGFYDIDAYYTHAERCNHDEEAEARAIGTIGKLLGSLAYRFEHGCEPTPEWWRSIIPGAERDGLEIGCGDGDRMRTFSPFLRHVRGVEPDPRAVRVARDERGLDVHEGTAELLPDAVKDRRYGLIVFTHVLEHTVDPVLSLQNARDLLADDGVMSIEVPNNGCEGARMMGEAWRWLDVPRHLNFFTPDSLQACAEAAGLTVRKVLYRGYVRQFMPDWITDEACIRAKLENREATQTDIDRQVRHSAKLLARTMLAPAGRKYDSVRILCSRN
ncbi:MAG: class I SAM-dependent methyltransferase [Rhodobacter sp.]|nr:class I SAM-dependent methyltransferase [Paracoccaceae bacterium]MCC0076415.1 class I SAM-dependent methyltransferase [Rhodobacter sp.]